MDTYFHLADRYAQSALHTKAFSAMPDAPVLPYVERRRRHPVRRVRAALALATRPRRRPAFRRAARSPNHGSI